MERRGLVKGALILGGAWAIVARPWTWFGAPQVSVEPFAPVPGFRQVTGSGEISAGGIGGAFLVGIDAPQDRDAALEARVAAQAEDLLLGGWTSGGAVPVTYFTDIRCPICRVLEPRLAALDGISLITREYPLFGDVSVMAARAVLAAEAQGAGEAMRRRLYRTRVVADTAAAERLAASLDLDVARFRGDLEGPALAARLAEDRALARLFRLPGTPALIVGRTRVVGLQPEGVLQALVDLEAAG